MGPSWTELVGTVCAALTTVGVFNHFITRAVIRSELDTFFKEKINKEYRLVSECNLVREDIDRRLDKLEAERD